MSEELDRELNRLKAYCDSRDLDSAEETMGILHKQWIESGGSDYAYRMRLACDTLAGGRFAETERARLLVERYATRTLSEADESQMGIQLHLLTSYFRLDVMPDKPSGRQWTRARKASAERWFGVWRDLEDAIDPAWDPEDPRNHVKPYLPPPTIIYVSGMSPEAIEDPRIRAEYEAHLKRNEEISTRNNQQRKLRKLRGEYAEPMTKYVISIYSVTPCDMEELERYLAGLKDENMKARIRNGVRANVPGE